MQYYLFSEKVNDFVSSPPHEDPVKLPTTEPVLQTRWIILIVLVITMLVLAVMIVVIIKTQRNRKSHDLQLTPSNCINEGFERATEQPIYTIPKVEDVVTLAEGES